MAKRGPKPTIQRTEENGWNEHTGSFFPFDPLNNDELEQAKENGIPSGLAWSRRHYLGWSKEDVIKRKVEKRSMGKRYLVEKHKERRIALGISEFMFEKKVFGEGYTPEMLFSDPQLYTVNRKGIGNKRKYHFTEEQLAIAASNGIDRYRVVQRVTRCKYTIERAITEPIGTTQRGRKKA